MAVLIDALLTDLQRDGFVVVPGAVSSELCDRAERDIDAFKVRNPKPVSKNADSEGRMNRIVNLHLVLDSLAELFSTNAALPVCDAFFETDTALYTSLYFERGSEQDLHRDSPAFVTRPSGKYLGVWAALEDVDADNGPLVVVPGSHLLPAIDVDAMARDLYGAPENAPASSDVGWETYQTTVKDQSESAGLAPIEVHVQRGDIIIWHPLLFHGGAPHHASRRTRRSLVMHVTPVGMPVYQQDVFFNPDKDVADVAQWRYLDDHGRKVAVFTAVDFGHEFTVPVDALRAGNASVPSTSGGMLHRGARTRNSRPGRS